MPEILSLLQTCLANIVDGPLRIVDRLCRALSEGDHAIVARHLSAIGSTGLAGMQYTVLNAALAFAVNKDRYQHAQELLVAGADANLALSCNFSILHLAILSGSRGCHILLLKHGANPNACGQYTWLSPLIDDLNFLLLQYVPKLDNLYSPLAYAMKLNHHEIAQDLLQAGAEVDDIKEEDLSTAMEDAVQRGDPYLIYLLSFKGYYDTRKKPILDSDHLLREAFMISQAHFDRSSTWPHLYQQNRLSRVDFEALWPISIGRAL